MGGGGGVGVHGGGGSACTPLTATKEGILPGGPGVARH